MNDDVELARELSADGIHVGQDDDSVSKIRELIGQEMWVGLSVSNDMELESAQKSGADYLGIGPFIQQIASPTQQNQLGLTI